LIDPKLEQLGPLDATEFGVRHLDRRAGGALADPADRRAPRISLPMAWRMALAFALP
jgi:hypothetical protein